MEEQLLPVGRVERGDILVFKFPEDPERDFIKRVIGLPGETLEVRQKQVHIDGRPLDEPYLRPEATTLRAGATPIDGRDNYGPVTIPDGHYFMMGDNRDNSQDSRYWGPLPHGHLKGRAMLVYWSYDARPSNHRRRRVGNPPLCVGGGTLLHGHPLEPDVQAGGLTPADRLRISRRLPRLAPAEDRRTHPYNRRAFLDGHVEVVAHAHRQLAQLSAGHAGIDKPVAELPQPPEPGPGLLGVCRPRGEHHQAANVDRPALRSGIEDFPHGFARRAVFGSLARQVDLYKQLRRRLLRGRPRCRAAAAARRCPPTGSMPRPLPRAAPCSTADARPGAT